MPAYRSMSLPLLQGRPDWQRFLASLSTTDREALMRAAGASKAVPPIGRMVVVDGEAVIKRTPPQEQP